MTMCRRGFDRLLAGVVADSVGYGFCEAGLEGGAFQQGGFSVVCQITHLDQHGGAAGAYQDFVIGSLGAVAAETRSGHRAGD